MPGWWAQLLYLNENGAPALRCVSGQSVRAMSYAAKVGLPPLHRLPSGMKPTVRPFASERSTLNQL